MDYIKELQAYMAVHDQKKADMARLFGVDWQTYHNWVTRKSLPKEYYDRAKEILCSNNKNSDMIEEVTRMLQSLSPEAMEMALKSIEMISDLDRKSS